MNPVQLSQVLIEKLTKKEIHAFIACQDDGSLEHEIMDIVMEQDKKNYPEDYKLTIEEQEINEQDSQFVLNGENVPQPICPINMYFEGDEDKCDISKCDWDITIRSCSEACKIKTLKDDIEIEFNSGSDLQVIIFFPS